MLCLKELEIKSENYFKLLQDANDNYSSIQIENRNLSNEITELLNKNKKIEEKIRSYELEYNENKFVKDKLTEHEEKEKNLKNDLRLIERENKVIP